MYVPRGRVDIIAQLPRRFNGEHFPDILGSAARSRTTWPSVGVYIGLRVASFRPEHNALK